MDDLPLYDVVYFKLVTHAAAEALAWSVRPTWITRVQPWSPGWSVFVELRSREADLAVLLRQVADWAAKRRLENIPFELDGREYVLLPARIRTPVSA